MCEFAPIVSGRTSSATPSATLAADRVRSVALARPPEGSAWLDRLQCRVVPANCQRIADWPTVQTSAGLRCVWTAGIAGTATVTGIAAVTAT
jgi:hypothetical protein